MDDIALLIDLHRDTARQGPGSEAATRKALALSGLAPSPDLRIADIGCGAGASTLVLAEVLGAQVTAVDLHPGFLARLMAEAGRRCLADRITPVAAAMEALPLVDGAFEAIWSEGAIYNMGFAAGLRAWRPLLKPGGVLAVSELTWFTTDRPSELTAYWRRAYPEVDTAAAKMALIEASGYAPLGYFVLPECCWQAGYYDPLAAAFEAFLARHGQSPAAQAVVAAERAEMALYARHARHFGYGFYVARRCD